MPQRTREIRPPLQERLQPAFAFSVPAIRTSVSQVGVKLLDVAGNHTQRPFVDDMLEADLARTTFSSICFHEGLLNAQRLSTCLQL